MGGFIVFVLFATFVSLIVWMTVAANRVHDKVKKLGKIIDAAAKDIQ